MKVILTDISTLPHGPEETITSVAKLKQWLIKKAKLAPQFYEILHDTTPRS